MILQKAPRLLLATTAPSSRERTTGARAPRLYRLRPTPLYGLVDDEGRATWEYGAKSATTGETAGEGKAVAAGSESACEEE
jgi:hypothetical protein